MTAAATLLGLATLAASGAAFAALSQAMDRHHEQVHGRGAVPTAARRRGLRVLGAAGLAAALAACLAVWGPAAGWVAWAGMLTLAAGATALASTYTARRVAQAAPVCAVAAAALLAAGLLLHG